MVSVTFERRIVLDRGSSSQFNGDRAESRDADALDPAEGEVSKPECLDAINRLRNLLNGQYHD